MSIFSRSTAAVLQSMALAAGESVTYKRGEESIEITGAIRGSTNQDAESKFPGSRIADRSVDWIIEADQLKTDAGATITPKRGDTVTDSAGYIYRVLPFSPSSDLWAWVDRQGQTRRRVFTKARN